MRRGRFRREKRIETRVCKRALEELQTPNIPLKLALGTENGWPDRLYLLGHGAVLFIEFKDPDEGELDAKQRLMHKLLRSMWYDVQVHDNEDEAIEAIRAAKLVAQRAQVPKESKEVSKRPRRRNSAS